MTEEVEVGQDREDAAFLMEGTEEGIKAFLDELVIPILIERSEGGYYDLETGENFASVPSKGMYEIRREEKKP